MPKISVIMPLYNVENFLRKSLDSVINQTFKDIEIVCVNDASTDGTLSILEEYAGKDDRIKIITNEVNQHCGGARNVGLKNSTGDYFIILDGDDWFELNMLEVLYNKAINDKSDIVVCGYYCYNEENKKITCEKTIYKNIIINSPISPKDFSEDLFQIFYAMTWNKLFKRDFFVNNNLLFDDSIVATDVSCILTSLVLAQKISAVSDCLIFYRTKTGENLTATRKENFDSVLYVINILEKNLRDLNLYYKYNETFIKKVESFLAKELNRDGLMQKQILERKNKIKESLSEETYCSIYGTKENMPIKKRKNMDFVYIVKNEEENEDLRYSLRSLDKFVPHDKIWIVGYKPSWVTNVNYLEVPKTGTKHQELTKSLIAICQCEEISDDFIFMNDDFFAIKPIDNLEESIDVRLGTLERSIEIHEKMDGTWHKAFKQLYELLEDLGVEKPYYNFESHTPLIMNKKKLLDVLMLPKVQEYIQSPKVLHRRSLYGNYYHLSCKMLSKDVKISRTIDDTMKKLDVCGWLSVYDNQIGNLNFPKLNSLFYELFPNSCKYEADQATYDRTLKIIDDPIRIIIPKRFMKK